MNKTKIECFRKNIRMLGLLIKLYEKEWSRHNEIKTLHVHILFAIAGVKKCSMVQLATILSLDKSIISRTINKLVKIGFVNRKINPGNRRSSVLALTSSGKKLIQNINRRNNILFKNALTEITQRNEDMRKACQRIGKPTDPIVFYTFSLLHFRNKGTISFFNLR